jgi:hypothetical protein
MHVAKVTDFASWRAYAREWLALGVTPDVATWSDARDPVAPLALEFNGSSSETANPHAFTLPRELHRALELCACHRSMRKWQ